MPKKKTGKKVASLASDLLKKDLSRKKEKSVAGSALSQAEKSKKKKKKVIMEEIKKSEINCGNCGNPFVMDDEGDHTQTCPNYCSQEMVKDAGKVK